ncbi:MAG: hypothetical protein OXG53_06470 [Chloroflexi bacterium]|nr:hypothetical protein [Chloroflexota bacterium]
MIEARKQSVISSQRVIFISAALAIAFLFLLTVQYSPPPTIDLEFGDTSIFIGSDRDWTLYPGDCVQIRWQLEGISSLHVDGAGRIGADEMRFCPDINATSPSFEVRAENGIYRSLRLKLHHLPDLLFYLVGFVSFTLSPMLAVYYVRLKRLEQPLPIFGLALGTLALIAIGAWLRLTPHEPPLIDKADGDVSVRIWSGHDRALFPHECVRIGWSVVGAQSVRYKGREVSADVNPASGEHCAEDGEYAQIEVVSQDDDSKAYGLAIESLFPGSFAPPPFFSISLLGIVLGVLIYLPLLARQGRAWRSKGVRADGISLIGCFFVVIVLYLPFGFDSSLHWESWIFHGYAEGGTLSFYATESVSRPWVNVPRTLAYLISSETFVGYHLVNFLLYAGEMTILYIILRQLGVSPLYAFLTTALFMFYPVNDTILTARLLPNTFSLFAFLLATALFLDYCKNPKRLTLLGMWLSLLYCVNSNEAGFVVILVVPLVLWLRDRRLTWRNVNLSVAWYLVPACKVAYVILLLATGRDFYQSGLLNTFADSPGSIKTIFDTFFGVLGGVYWETFVGGWGSAFETVEMNQWWLPTVIILAGVSLIAWFHLREADADKPSARQIGASMASGLLLIIAAIGLLMWVPYYREDAWRMYQYVPVGAAFVVLSLLLLITSPVLDNLRRQMIVVCLCLLLLVPAASRLFSQHNRFRESAYRKARILHQVMEIAPAFAPNAQLAVITELDRKALGERGIREFIAADMLNSALHVLYEDRAPEYAYFCHSKKYCGDFSGDETIFSSAAPGDLLRTTLVMVLSEDLSVELVEDPAEFLGLDLTATYDAGELYNAEATLPPRAATMLGATLGG